MGEGTADIFVEDMEDIGDLGRKLADFEILVEEQGADAGTGEEVVDVVVEFGQFDDLVLVFGVDRVQFLVGRLQFLVGALQLLVAGQQFLVGGLQFLVGGLQLLDGRLQVFPGELQFLLEVLDSLLASSPRL
jgi:hypothetical protein